MSVARIESVYANRSYAYNLSSDNASQLSSVLYRYFGNEISADKFDSLLLQYGITATGIVDHDIQALYNAIHSNATSKINSKLSQNQNINNATQEQTVPWANLMSQVGLAASGEITDDKERFYSKISEMQQAASSSTTQQANINQLLAEAGIVFVAIPAQEQQQIQTASGADIAALMNKQFFFGGTMSTF